MYGSSLWESYERGRVVTLQNIKISGGSFIFEKFLSQSQNFQNFWHLNNMLSMQYKIIFILKLQNLLNHLFQLEMCAKICQTFIQLIILIKLFLVSVNYLLLPLNFHCSKQVSKLLPKNYKWFIFLDIFPILLKFYL